MGIASLTDRLEEKGKRVKETIANDHVSAIPRLAPSFEPIAFLQAHILELTLSRDAPWVFDGPNRKEDLRRRGTIVNNHLRVIPLIPPSLAPEAF